MTTNEIGLGILAVGVLNLVWNVRESRQKKKQSQYCPYDGEQGGHNNSLLPCCDCKKLKDC